MKQIKFMGGLALCSLFVGVLFPIEFSSAKVSPVTVKVTTDKASYVVGEPVAITITAVSNSGKDETLGFSSSYQTDYVIDGKFRWSSDKAFAAVTTQLIVLARGGYARKMIHSKSDYPLAAGSHTITGEVVGYGSAFATINVLRAASTSTVPTRPTPTAPATSTAVRVQANVLNVRQGPTSSAKKIGSVRRGDVLKKFEEKGGWIKTQLPNGQTGWVLGQHVAPATAPVPVTTPVAPAPRPAKVTTTTPGSGAAPAVTAPRERVIVTVRVLNVRSAPGLNGKIIATVRRNNVLGKVEVKDGWVKVVLPNGKSGWVSGEFIK